MDAASTCDASPLDPCITEHAVANLAAAVLDWRADGPIVQTHLGQRLAAAKAVVPDDVVALLYRALGAQGRRERYENGGQPDTESVTESCRS